MNHLVQELNARYTALQSLIDTCQARKNSYPEGRLRTYCQQGKTRYYYRKSNSDVNGTYLNRSQSRLIGQLAQKDYDEKVLAAAREEQFLIDAFRKLYHPDLPEKVFDELPPLRQSLVVPEALSASTAAKQWEETTYTEKGGFSEDYPEYYTDRNERVRSKSELIIANRLHLLGIPYRYEAPLYLDGYGTVHPDFTLLHPDGRTICWEHLGMTDDPDYAVQNLERIRAYEANGYFPGTHLILTLESGRHPLSSIQLDAVIRHYFGAEH